jgi:hypothetical protein
VIGHGVRGKGTSGGVERRAQQSSQRAAWHVCVAGDGLMCARTGASGGVSAGLGAHREVEVLAVFRQLHLDRRLREHGAGEWQGPARRLVALPCWWTGEGGCGRGRVRAWQVGRTIRW